MAQVGTNYHRQEMAGYEILKELALNLRWSWNHRTDHLWKLLDERLFEETQNPWIVLQTVSKSRLEHFLSDPNFLQAAKQLLLMNHEEETSSAWFQRSYPLAPFKHMAYFSMEYMLTEALPIYSGGLGNVAGDQLKAASDLGLPVSAIGLLFQEGYFRQMIDKQGRQQALYPYNDPGQLPLQPLRNEDGEWLRLEIALPGYSVWLRTWHVRVGRVNLYLLDSNDMSNFPVHRGITSQLYGGSEEVRLQQELILGIGGFRLLKALGIEPEVCHLNEGHAAFVVLERARSYMAQHDTAFDVSLAATRPGNVFTTHTAVPAGFDRFSPTLIQQYLGAYAKDKLNLPLKALLALGRANEEDPSEPFNMAYLAIRGSGAVNGVSNLHAKVSQELFAPLFPRWPTEGVPIGYVTNGVHMPSWDSAAADKLWTKACGKDRWLGSTETLEKSIRSLPDSALWAMRLEAKEKLINEVTKRLTRQLSLVKAPAAEIKAIQYSLKPYILTLGFARRFAAYKRPNLLLYDQQRLLKILNDEKRPVQLIVAGKAHPADEEGKALIERWQAFIKQVGPSCRVVFLSDYDMLLAQELVRGVDVWINTPKRPWEACGTSGMKVLVNGGLNLSELDGWWAEAYNPKVGFALGSGDKSSLCDSAEAYALYDKLENEIIPEFYERNVADLPVRWIERIRASMAQLTPQFSANRSVRQYTHDYYIPAAKAYKERTHQGIGFITAIAKEQSSFKEKWRGIAFGQLSVKATQEGCEFTVPLFLNGLDPKSVKVELYADGEAPQEMQRQNTQENKSSFLLYTLTLKAHLPPQYYTPRLIPAIAGLQVPLEAPYILWQR